MFTPSSTSYPLTGYLAQTLAADLNAGGKLDLILSSFNLHSQDRALSRSQRCSETETAPSSRRLTIRSTPQSITSYWAISPQHPLPTKRLSELSSGPVLRQPNLNRRNLIHTSGVRDPAWVDELVD